MGTVSTRGCVLGNVPPNVILDKLFYPCEPEFSQHKERNIMVMKTVVMVVVVMVLVMRRI